MAGEARNSDLILSQAKHSLVRNRDFGGRRNQIGRRSAAMRREYLLRKLIRAGLAVGAILFASTLVGLIIDGIGWTGIIVTLLAIVAAVGVFGAFPRMKVPSLQSLGQGDVKSLVGRTELWLEAQRPALPAPAVQIVDRIGLQLDALALQLDGLPAEAPAAAEVRKLVGEHLPGLVSTYTSIPKHLRTEPRAGRSPDEQLADSLGKISTEIDSVTRQLAEGQIDKLAIQTRYLDYKYGEALEETDRP